MRITVNGARLFFDIEGAGLVPDGPAMTHRPTLILLHGGPGADHSLYKPGFGALADICQIVYLDHRGNGRSDPGTPGQWTLDQWADDLHGFCQALDIERPIVLGTSFGGFVAQAYAARYPDNLAKLILISTAAKFEFEEMYAAFERIGGGAARDAAEAYWGAPTVPTRRRYAEVCLPLYTQSPMDPDVFARILLKDDVALHFNGPLNEQGRMDFRDKLADLTCPVLVMAGEEDPITPIVFSERIVAALPPEQVRFERIPNAGHGVVGDAPVRAIEALREFILD